MLLARVAAELRTVPELRGALLPVRFMEDNQEVFDIGDFWLEALVYLAAECREQHPGLSREIKATHADLANRPTRDDIAGHARAALLDAADRLERRLVLMVENLQDLFDDVDENFGWQLRESLQTDPEIMLLGTATSRFEALDDAREPFFELFRILPLRHLTTAECVRLWHAITGEQRGEREMRPLEILTGGSPRLLVIVAEFARHRTVPKLLEELVGLVDDHSEYFRGNLNSLPKTERRVYVALADLWTPSSTREVANRGRMGVRKTSALLGRLVRRGAVKVDGDGGSRLYSVAEPLHCIYYKMRRWRDEAAVVRGLIRFMVAFYGPDETTRILGTLMADEAYQQAFRRAEEDLAGKSGETEPSIEHHAEFIRRYGSSSNPEVQGVVAAAVFHRAESIQRAGEHRAAVTAFHEVVTRFGRSAVPDVQGCVAAALVSAGYLHGRLGDPDAAIGCYDEVIRRFGGSLLPQPRSCVATALLNKGSTVAGSGSRESAHSAIAIWDDIIERFGLDGEPDIQVQVASALTKKATAQVAMGRGEEAVAVCDDVVRRYRTSDRPELRREVAMALESKATSLNRMGRGREALEACDILVRDFGEVAGQLGIRARWRSMGNRIHALVLEGEESAASQVFREMCADLDFADREMIAKIIWDTIDLMAAGANPGVFADALARGAERCRELVPLLTALRRLAGRPARVPHEFEEVVGDIVRMTEERKEWVVPVRA